MHGSSVVVAVDEREDFCVGGSSVVVAVGKGGSRDFLTGFQARMFNLHNTQVCNKKILISICCLFIVQIKPRPHTSRTLKEPLQLDMQTTCQSKKLLCT